MTLGLAVARWALRRPDSVALYELGRERTWRELDERTNRLATMLSECFGVLPGDRVALLAPNRMEVVEVLVATHKAGAAYVGLNFRFDPDELLGALENAAPKVLIAAGDLAERAREVAARLGLPVIDLEDAGPDGYETLLVATPAREPAAMHRVHPAELGCIVYTSGTTGRPKGVTFSHAAMLQHATIACLEYEIRDDTRYLVQIPHNSSVNITMAPCLVAGAAIGFADNRSFEPDRFAHTVGVTGTTHTFLVPTQLMRILDQLPAEDARMSGLTTLGYGSSPIAPHRLAELIGRFGPIFIQLYGMAEIASIGTLLRKQDHVRALADAPQLLTAAGQPSMGVDVLVVGSDGEPAQVGERGEVVFAGPHVMLGYHRDPERTAEAIVDGRMHSGDIGRMDEEGYLYIVDRMKNLIIRGGQNIVPTEIENVLYEHAAVLEATVVGAPDPEWGERVVAVVTLRQSADVHPDELLDFVRSSRLPRFKHPEEVRVVDALPKSPVGKIDKRAVRGWFWDTERAV